MIVTLNLPPDIEQALIAEAQSRGLSLDELVRVLLLDRQPSSPMRTQFSAELSPEEWVRQFKIWTRSHAGDDLPLLSDEAMSREFIYRERGL
jgi:predicted nucleic acid-binding protein